MLQLFIAGQAIHYTGMFFRDARRSEIDPAFKQVPFTVHNLRLFIESPVPSLTDKLRAATLIVDMLDPFKITRKALSFKRNVENGTVKIPSQDAILAALGVKDTPPELAELAKLSDYYKPYSQQVIAAWYILQRKRCEILYDMRVGKTLSAIIALKQALNDGLVDHGIIVCPKPIIESVWVKELLQENLSCYCMTNGQVKDDNTLSYQDVDCYLISYESLVQRLPLFQKYLDMERLFIIADETSLIKNPDARRRHALRVLTHWPEYVVMLTGSPMEQGPQDMYAQRFCVDRGSTMGAHMDEFIRKFCYRTYNNKLVLRGNKKMEFELAIQQRSLRYVRSEADQFSGKDKNFRYIRLSPTKQQFEATENAVNGLVRMFQEDPGQNIKTHVLVLYGFLREICCGYNKLSVDEGKYARFRFDYDSKVLWLETFLESNPGVPALVFSEFDEHEEQLAEMLDRLRIPYVWLKRDTKRFGAAEVQRRFQEGDVRVMLMKTSQGYGMTLNRIPAVKAHLGTYPVMIYMAPTWRLGAFLQSQDRCVGVDADGNNIVTPIYMLSVKGSIEEKIVTALKKKQDVQQTLLKDVERDGFYSFVDELRLDMSSTSDDKFFDPEEMHSRKVLGLSPQKSVTLSKLKKLVPGYDSENIYSLNNLRVKAANYLHEKYVK